MNRSFLVSPSVCCGHLRGIPLRMSRGYRTEDRSIDYHLQLGGRDASSTWKLRIASQDEDQASSSTGL